MFTFQHIYKAYMACRKTKRNTSSQLLFERDLLTNLWDLQRDLSIFRYNIRYVDDFVLFDESKERLEFLKQEIERYLEKELHLKLREDSKLKRHAEGLDFLGYVIRPNYTLVRQRVVKNFKKKKAKYLNQYESKKGKMELLEIKKFLSVKASFVSHSKHADSFNLLNKVGTLNENNPFDYARTE
jgi:hypothetical protein